MKLSQVFTTSLFAVVFHCNVFSSIICLWFVRGDHWMAAYADCFPMGLSQKPSVPTSSPNFGSPEGGNDLGSCCRAATTTERVSFSVIFKNSLEIKNGISCTIHWWNILFDIRLCINISFTNQVGFSAAPCIAVVWSLFVIVSITVRLFNTLYTLSIWTSIARQQFVLYFKWPYHHTADCWGRTRKHRIRTS